jgi:hypothetical protein
MAFAVGARRVVPALVASFGLLVAASPAHASDASLRRALKPYTTRLTRDIGYLSSFTVRSKKAVPGVIRRLTGIRRDLAGATRAATVNHASSKPGRRGRELVLLGLHDATVAAGKARASANAVRSGRRALATRDQRQERREINMAIRALEAGGKLLHLF